MSNIARLALSDSESLAYCKNEGQQPGIIFLSGFRSDMNGAKATALEAWCKEQNRSFIRFDYRGHGQSDGDFKDYTIGHWKQDAIHILDKVTDGPQVLVGSSMGGWLMLLAALARPQKVAGLVGIASAPDFTEHLLLDAFTPEQKIELKEHGVVHLPDCMGGESYPVTLNLIVESGDHLVLDGPINITCPVHLIHGMQDKDVPWEFSVTLNEKLKSKDVKTTLVDDGDHRMSSDKHIRILIKAVDGMLQKLEVTEDA
jgi:pimeloyl-ACP methyl ester carboxylesterase